MISELYLHLTSIDITLIDMLFHLVFKALKTFGQGGDIINSLSGYSRACLAPITDEILLQPAYVLAEKIRKREYSSEQVVRAFINRARVVNVLLNAIIDERFDDAIQDAKAIDEFLKTTELSEKELAEQKPLLGLPFTTKDSIQVTGMKWSSGCVKRKDIVAEEDAPVVSMYRKAGAIPIALTNVPELLLWFATSNKLYGTTNNPFDLSRTPGGSSGGEAALITAGASPLSICSDVGGSIRMPAFHCGLFGHKPSSTVIDWRGTYPQVKDGLEEIFAFGPITRHVDDIILSLRVLAGEGISKLHKIDEPVDLRKVRVFYLEETGDNMSTTVEPYISDSIRQAAEHLRVKFGCEVQRAKFSYFKHISMWYTLLFPNNQEVASLITDNTYKINPFLELAKSVVGLSEYSPAGLTVAAAQATTQATFSPEAAPQMHEKALETLRLARKEFKALLGDDGIFLYVCLPRTAPTHNFSVFDFGNVCCPMVMNYLGAPVTQVPTGMKDGLPYGIQVAAAPMHDRLTIAVAKELEQVFGGWIKPCDVVLNGKFVSTARKQSEPIAPYTCADMNSTSGSSSFEVLGAMGDVAQ